jgi:hypothetical protein
MSTCDGAARTDRQVAGIVIHLLIETKLSGIQKRLLGLTHKSSWFLLMRFLTPRLLVLAPHPTSSAGVEAKHRGQRNSTGARAANAEAAELRRRFKISTVAKKKNKSQLSSCGSKRKFE